MAFLTAPPASTPEFLQLTPRERWVFDLMAAGLANADIAARMSLAPNTVSNHITNVFAKLQVASRAEAIIRARESGLGDSENSGR